jgi:hypothetical protein
LDVFWLRSRSRRDRSRAPTNSRRCLGLKRLGADEISDNLTSINWLICGTEYIVLVDRGNIIADAMPWPAHSKQSPAFSGICRRGGKELPDIVVAILDGAHRRLAAGHYRMEDRSAAREVRQDPG